MPQRLALRVTIGDVIGQLDWLLIVFSFFSKNEKPSTPKMIKEV